MFMKFKEKQKQFLLKIIEVKNKIEKCKTKVRNEIEECNTAKDQNYPN